MESAGARFGADWLGKLKMILQCAAVIAVFLEQIIRASWPASQPFLPRLRDFLIYAMLAATLFSGVQYLWCAGQVWRSGCQRAGHLDRFGERHP